MEKVEIGSKLCSSGERKYLCSCFTAQITRNSLSKIIIIQKHPARYILFSLTDRKKGTLNRLIQGKNSDVQHVFMKVTSREKKKKKKPTQMVELCNSTLVLFRKWQGEKYHPLSVPQAPPIKGSSHLKTCFLASDWL